MHDPFAERTRSPPEVFATIRRWANGLCCLASHVRTIAVATPGCGGGVVLCSTMQRVCAEVLPVARHAVENGVGDDPVRVRADARAATSVFERALGVIADWMAAGAATTSASYTATTMMASRGACVVIPGQTARVHWAMTICFALLSSPGGASGGGLAATIPTSEACDALRALTRACLDASRRALVANASSLTVRHRALLTEATARVRALSASSMEDTEMSAPARSRQLDRRVIQLLLARLCFHYTDGELIDAFAGQWASRQRAPVRSSSAPPLMSRSASTLSPSTSCDRHGDFERDAFFLSVPNHAALLATVALRILITSAHECSTFFGAHGANKIDDMTGVEWFFDGLRRGWWRKRCPRCRCRLRIRSRHACASPEDFLQARIRAIAVPFAVAPTATPSLLHGLCFWVQPASYFQAALAHDGSGATTKREAAAAREQWEEEGGQGWYANQSFRAECGALPTRW